MAKEKKSKGDSGVRMPDKNGHLTPTKEDLRIGKAAPRGRNRGRHR